MLENGISIGAIVADVEGRKGEVIDIYPNVKGNSNNRYVHVLWFNGEISRRIREDFLEVLEGGE